MKAYVVEYALAWDNAKELHSGWQDTVIADDAEQAAEACKAAQLGKREQETDDDDQPIPDKFTMVTNWKLEAVKVSDTSVDLISPQVLRRLMVC